MFDNREIIDSIICNLLNGKIENGSSFSSSIRRIATWSLPEVNYGFQNNDSNKTLAILFSVDYPDNESLKRSTITVLNRLDAAIVAFDVQSLSSGDSFVQSLNRDRLMNLPVGVIIYDNIGNISVLKQFQVSSTTAKKRTFKEKKSYWCWWRDSSQYEVATLLELSYKYDNEDGDIYTDRVYPEFFSMMIEGKTKQWDGTPRKKSYSKSSYKAEKQNYKIPMCQLGLWEIETGHITDKGLELLNVIKTYGSESKEYFDCLAKLILIDGKHLDLVKDLDEFQKEEPELIPFTSEEFFVLFDDYMMKKNSIGTRKPSAVKTGAKKSYVRDEPKLWNKLGILKKQGSNRYFKPFVGIEFNWERINEILLSDVLGENDE